MPEAEVLMDPAGVWSVERDADGVPAAPVLLDPPRRRQGAGLLRDGLHRSLKDIFGAVRSVLGHVERLLEDPRQLRSHRVQPLDAHERVTSRCSTGTNRPPASRVRVRTTFDFRPDGRVTRDSATKFAASAMSA